MFNKKDILFEDNHLLIVNKRSGQPVQTDETGDRALEEDIKAFIKERDNKPGNVFLGIVHRIDRPVSGAVLFAKSAKALTRLNEMIRDRRVEKIYWAIVDGKPSSEHVELTHYIGRNSKINKAVAYDTPKGDCKIAKLSFDLICVSQNFNLLQINLVTGRHHQIRAQLSKIGLPIKGDLKYGAKRSNKGGGISLHARQLKLQHPVTKEMLEVTAPVPMEDNLWKFFDECLR